MDDKTHSEGSIEREFSPKKYSIMCTDVPDELFDVEIAKKHFAKFGRVSRIFLRPKKQSCMVEYETYNGAALAILNAGAFDGFVFNVTWVKRKRLRSKKDDDPEWKPDSEVEEELRAMGGGTLIRSPRLHKQASQTLPSFRSEAAQKLEHMRRRPSALTSKTRTQMNAVTSSSQNRSAILLHRKPNPSSFKKANDIMPAYRKHPSMLKSKIIGRSNSGIKKVFPVSEKRKAVPPAVSRSSTPVQISQVPATGPTSMSLSEAIAELKSLRNRQARTAEDKFRTLEARDRALRVIGGPGNRNSGGGAIAGTCPDMCPEKERLRRDVENQVASFECSSGAIDPSLAVKQYSRSSADQESPMCYELRPASILKQTMLHLLHNIADACNDEEDLEENRMSEWFHFLWDRFRCIRKDIAQQALCCLDSVRLIEQCARFHAHCSARLAGYDSTTFDQRLNSDNLTKCLQTLKHMYHDLRVRGGSEQARQNESEFRGYIALLNLGDANFMCEVQQLEPKIQISPEIKFAIKIFMALDNNNYIRFFRLVRNASYLQACILLRYFNDVRARALARIVKAYVSKTPSAYPANILMDNLAFEDLNSMELFLNHYALKISNKDSELVVVLDKSAFCGESEPYPIDRAPSIIESKLDRSIGEMLAGGTLEKCFQRNPHSSFDNNGYLKESSLYAEDQGYKLSDDATTKSLKSDIATIGFGNLKKPIISEDVLDTRKSNNVFSNVTSNSKPIFSTNLFSKENIIENKKSDNIFNSTSASTLSSSASMFTFTPAISMVSPGQPKGPSVNILPENVFTFSKPSDMEQPKFAVSVTSNKNIFSQSDEKKNLFPTMNPFLSTTRSAENIFSGRNKSNVNVFGNSNVANPFGKPESDNLQTIFPKSGQGNVASKSLDTTDNIFKTSTRDKVTSVPSLFSNTVDTRSAFVESGSSLKNIFSKDRGGSNAYDLFAAKSNNLTADKNAINVSEFPGSANIFGSKSITPSFANDTAENLNDKIMRKEMEAEDKRLAELALQQEEARKQLEMKKIEEEKRQKEIERKEEERKRLEKIKLEEERKAAELLKQEEEKKRSQLLKQIDDDAEGLLSLLIDEVDEETVREFIDAEKKSLDEFLDFVDKTCEEVILNVCMEECLLELKCEQFSRKRLVKKWGGKWKKATDAAVRRHNALSNMPIWLPDKSLKEEAESLQKSNFCSILSNMHDFHRGLKLTSPPRPLPELNRLNVFELINEPLLRRIERLKSLPFENTIFWKVAISLPDRTENAKNWMDLCKIVHNLFGTYDLDGHILYLREHNWHKKIAICINEVVGSTNDSPSFLSDNISTANAIIIYIMNNSDLRTIDERIEQLFSSTLQYQVVPVAVVAPGLDSDIVGAVENKLQYYLIKNIISEFKVFSDSLRSSSVNRDAYSNFSARALSWTARRLPPKHTLEINSLHNVLHQCIGDELWYRFKLEEHSAMKTAFVNPNTVSELYNEALKKTERLLLNNNIYQYPGFPEEFKQFLPKRFVYPQSYEYFPKDWKSSDRAESIKGLLSSCRLPNIHLEWSPKSASTLQNWIRDFCMKCLWFPKPEDVTVKIISLLPFWLNDPSTDETYFDSVLTEFGIQGLFGLIVKEKIEIETQKTKYKTAVYEMSDLKKLRTASWWYDVPIIAALIPEVIPADDDLLDRMIECHNLSKRQKLDDDSFNESNACSFESALRLAETSIDSYKQCQTLSDDLETILERGRQKTAELEKALQAALNHENC